jgi:peptidoglycan/LPS O-acetylase OafA/YrhL
MTRLSPSRFQEIDALRGLAALAVVLSHYLPYWDQYAYHIPVLVPNAVGYYAVNLFFIISGFVIFVTVERCSSARDFAVLRFSRLYPVYWMSLLISTAVGVLLARQLWWAGGFLVNTTMFQQFFGYTHFDNVYWSLEVEMTFYFAVGALLAVGWIRKVHGFLTVWLILAALWVVVFRAPGSVTAWGVVATERRDWAELVSAFDYSPFFAIGILCYQSWREGWTRQAGALLALAFFVQLLLAGWQGASVTVFFALVLWLAVNGRVRFLVNRFTLWLGTISYSLYLTHRNLGYLLLTWLHHHGVSATTAIATALLGALTLATTLTYAIERPASVALRSWYAARRRVHELPLDAARNG